MKRDPAVVDVIIEESLRFDAPVQMLFRTCMRPTTLETTDLAEKTRYSSALARPIVTADTTSRLTNSELSARPARPPLVRNRSACLSGGNACPNGGAYCARAPRQDGGVDQILLEPPPTYNPTFFACGVKSLWLSSIRLIPTNDVLKNHQDLASPPLVGETQRAHPLGRFWPRQRHTSSDGEPEEQAESGTRQAI